MSEAAAVGEVVVRCCWWACMMALGAWTEMVLEEGEERMRRVCSLRGW